MISRDGAGDTADQALYVTALADGAYIAAVRLVSAADPDTFVDLKLNGGLVQRSGAASIPLPPVTDLQPGDVFTYDIQNSSAGAWAFEFRLYPQGDVAYEAP